MKAGQLAVQQSIPHKILNNETATVLKVKRNFQEISPLLFISLTLRTSKLNEVFVTKHYYFIFVIGGLNQITKWRT